ncbi:hypothetical protein cyc_08539 [Cyclospora cayetanensis]|uniref:Uncharacterized protein n=1 Tax=Cyclospora cayetanensis TaxID=88456 RepID=A0A1D3CSC3_9EIME|nr:hypothetical protein cyc_08539 [Cyclospora cayetanensis]
MTEMTTEGTRQAAALSFSTQSAIRAPAVLGASLLHLGFEILPLFTLRNELTASIDECQSLDSHSSAGRNEIDRLSAILAEEQREKQEAETRVILAKRHRDKLRKHNTLVVKEIESLGAATRHIVARRRGQETRILGGEWRYLYRPQQLQQQRQHKNALSLCACVLVQLATLETSKLILEKEWFLRERSLLENVLDQMLANVQKARDASKVSSPTSPRPCFCCTDLWCRYP